MEKTATARAYCAYALRPDDAIVPDRVMFSPTHHHYGRIFVDRNVRELIIPYIFMHLLGELHRRWCRELQDSPSDKAARDKGIISKDTVKYYILKFVSESMAGLDGPVRESVENALITSFQSLKKEDAVPAELVDVAQATYDSFMASFDVERKETWPGDLIKKIESKGYIGTDDDVPSPYDVMHVLRQRGSELLPHLLRSKRHMDRQMGGDAVQARLRKITGATR